MNYTRSSICKVKCDVHQGSILGQKLLSIYIYINYIFKRSNVLKFILFADDTNVFCSGTNIKMLSELVDLALSKLHR